MEAGKNPILRAQERILSRHKCKILVYISERKKIPDIYARSMELMNGYGLARDPRSVVIFLNKKSKEFSVLTGSFWNPILSEKKWESLTKDFAEDLRSTYFENAVAVFIHTLDYMAGTYTAKAPQLKIPTPLKTPIKPAQKK